MVADYTVADVNCNVREEMCGCVCVCEQQPLGLKNEASVEVPATSVPSVTI